MKRLFFVFALVLLMVQCVFAQEWYTQVTKNHARPVLPDAQLLEKYGAVSLADDTKKVYLTFDAGYENGNVAKIADVLRQNGVKGAFFILSNIVDTHPELIQRLYEDGNLICNHTKKHPDMTQKDEKAFKDELLAMEQYYFEKTGRKLDKFYRPPEGKYNEQNLKWAKDLGYTTVFWSVAYRDWDNGNQMDGEKALSLLLSRVHNGAVILLHPTSATNAEILDRFIKALKSQGYEFGLINEQKSGDGQ